MDAIIVFGCMFVPLAVLSALSAGRDVLLFRPRERMRRPVTLAAMALGLLTMLALGMPPALAVALALVGPAASSVGWWLGSGEWIVLQHRMRRRSHPA